MAFAKSTLCCDFKYIITAKYFYFKFKEIPFLNSIIDKPKIWLIKMFNSFVIDDEMTRV